MKFRLWESTHIVQGGEYDLPTGEWDGVQAVSVTFAAGQSPPDWPELPDGEGNWAQLPPQEQERLAGVLKTAIQAGAVKEVALYLDPWEEDAFLCGEFREGWATLLYTLLDECNAAPYRPECPSGEEMAPVQIGGQTPVPRMCALEDLGQAADILLWFLQTGTLYPQIQWAVQPDNLPWETLW